MLCTLKYYGFTVYCSAFKEAGAIDRLFFQLESPVCSAARPSLLPVLPLRKLYTEQMFALLRTKRMRLRNHADTAGEALQGLCDICT